MNMSRQVRRQIDRLSAKGYNPEAIRAHFSGRKFKLIRTPKGKLRGKAK